MIQRLSSQEVEEITKAYGLRVRATVPMRSVTGLITDRGKFICKRYEENSGMLPVRILAIVDVKDQLSDLGLCQPYLRTKIGEKTLVINGVHITIEPWIPGRHADFRVRSERIAAIKAVARLHAVRIRVPKVLHFPPTLMEKLSYRLHKAQEVVEQGRMSGLSESQWRIWKKRAEDSIRRLPTDQLRMLTERDRTQGITCHRDLAPHNILVQQGMPAHLIDFDLAGVDTPLYDLHQLFEHVRYSAPRERDWEMELLEAYAQIAPLSNLHVRTLASLSTFPSILLREIAESAGRAIASNDHKRAIRVQFARTIEEERLGFNP